MNDEPQEQPPPPPAPDGPGEGEPVDEAELRRRIEESMREVRLQDVLLESVVTIVNLTARRIGKEDERDLEQAKIGIDAIRSLVDLLEPEPQTQVRNALSELQMLYARYAGGGEGGEAPPEAPEAPDEAGGAANRGPGLWTPPGT